MAEEMLLLLDIAAMLLFAKVFGEIAERLRVDAMVGEMFAGLLLGPILLWVRPNTQIAFLANIGLVLLLFLMGMETRFQDIKKDAYSGSTVAIVAGLFAFFGGLAIGFFAYNSLQGGALLGVALMGSSTAIPLKILERAGQLKTRLGQFITTMSVADDIFTIIALSLVSSWIVSGIIHPWTAAALFFGVLGFILFLMTAGSRLTAGVLHLFHRMRDEQVMFSVPLAIVFVIAFISEKVGIAAITGAFLAGMAMSQSAHAGSKIMPKTRALGHGFFIPLFFVYSAMLIDIALLARFWWLLVVITAVGIFTKVVGAYGSSHLFNFREKEMGAIAISTIPRGEYGIAIAQIGLTLGVLANEVYGAIIGFAIISIIVTLPLFRFYTRRSYFRV